MADIHKSHRNKLIASRRTQPQISFGSKQVNQYDNFGTAEEDDQKNDFEHLENY